MVGLGRRGLGDESQETQGGSGVPAGFGLEQGLGIGDMMPSRRRVEDLTHGWASRCTRGEAKRLCPPHRSVQHKAADHSAPAKPPAYRLLFLVRWFACSSAASADGRNARLLAPIT